MKPIKVPTLSTLLLFAITGLVLFYAPLPNLGASHSVSSEVFR